MERVPRTESKNAVGRDTREEKKKKKRACRREGWEVQFLAYPEAASSSIRQLAAIIVDGRR